MIIWVLDRGQKKHMIGALHDKLKMTPEVLSRIFIEVINSNTSDCKIFKPTIHFYDEIIRDKTEPKTLAIRSFQSDENVYIFNKNNLPQYFDIDTLRKMEAQIGKDKFRAEFMSGVIE